MPDFSIIDINSFWNIWYWILTVIAWSMTAHFTLGVPHDAVTRADRLGGNWEAHCDAIAVVYATRLRYFVDQGGVIFAAIFGFLLTSLAMLGFYYDIELAQAVFVLIAPLLFVASLSAKLASRILAENLAGDELRRALSRRRFWNQVIGLVAIIVQTTVAIYYHLHTTNIYPF